MLAVLVVQALVAAAIASDAAWRAALEAAGAARASLMPFLAAIVFATSIAAAVLLGLRARMLVRLRARTALLEREVATDALTGLGNRRSFDAAIQSAWARAVRERTGISLILIDIDHFKPFNDTYGHLEGDRVIRAAADAVRNAADHECTFRFGGEEFAVVLPGVAVVDAVRAGATIQRAIEDLRWPHAAGVNGHVTVSLGVAEAFPASAPLAPEALIGAADRALYGAKQEGRARLRVATLATPPATRAAAGEETVDGLDILLPGGSILRINTRLRLETVASITALLAEGRQGAAREHGAGR